MKNYKKKNFYEQIDDIQIKQNKGKNRDVSFSVLGDTTIFHKYEDNAKCIIIKDKLIAEMMKEVFYEIWDQ